MESVANPLMEPLLEKASMNPPQKLRGLMKQICRDGCISEGDLVYFAALRAKRCPPTGADAWASERWVNQVPLTVPLASSWQTALLSCALAFTDCIIPKARVCTPLPLQVTIALNNEDEDEDDAIPAGSLFLNVLRQSSDDLRSLIHSYSQPVLILTYAAPVIGVNESG